MDGRKLLTGLVASVAFSLSGCHWITLASKGVEETRPDASNAFPQISADGRIVIFNALGPDPVPDTPPDPDALPDMLFAYDAVQDSASLVSVSSNSESANADAGNGTVSGNGRYVAFHSAADNLVAGDTNGVEDVFLRDLHSGTTTRVSLGIGGVQGDDASFAPSLSVDGRYVAFTSYARNLIAGGSNGIAEVYVRDLDSGTTVLASRDSVGNPGNFNSNSASLSANGRRVAFWSGANNLVPGDANFSLDIFVHDLDTGVTTRANVSSAGTPANGFSFNPVLSADGRFVAFDTNSSNLVPGDTNIYTDVFVHDLDTGVTSRVSVASDGAQGDSASSYPSISADGRYVSFTSNSSNLVAGDTNGSSADYFVHDRQTGTTSLVSRDALGNPVPGGSGSYSALSADGRYIAFQSHSSGFIDGDHDDDMKSDIYLRAVTEVAVTSVVPNQLAIGATTAVTVSGRYFFSGTVPSVQGANVSNVVIVNENTITMNVTVPAARSAGPRNLYVNQFGTGAGKFTGVSLNCAGCISLY